MGKDDGSSALRSVVAIDWVESRSPQNYSWRARSNPTPAEGGICVVGSGSQIHDFREILGSRDGAGFMWGPHIYLFTWTPLLDLDRGISGPEL